MAITTEICELLILVMNIVAVLVLIYGVVKATVKFIKNEVSHASQIQGFFDIPVDHLMGAPLIADYFDRLGLTGANGDVVVVSPDHATTGLGRLAGAGRTRRAFGTGVQEISGFIAA